MGRSVVRMDHPHPRDGAGQGRGRPAVIPRCERPEIHERLARLVGDGESILIFGREAGALAQALEQKGCRAVIGTLNEEGRPSRLDPVAPHSAAPDGRDSSGGEEGPGGGRFDVVIVAGLLGRLEDHRSILRSLQSRIRPGGSLIVALEGVTACGSRLAIVDDEPLGIGSGVVFTREGLLGLFEDAEYAITRFEGDEPSLPAGGADSTLLDCLIVAVPLPVPGLDFVKRRMRELAEQTQEATREAEELRRRATAADRRLEALAGHETRMAGRVKELRAQLLAAHAEMIRRDDEIRRSYGDAIFERNALLIERDVLARERDDLADERSALIAERDSLESSLRSAIVRLNVFRLSPLGLAYRAIRKLLSRRRGTDARGR